MYCSKCRKFMRKGECFRYGQTECLCEECMEKEMDAGNICPNCGYEIEQKHEEVGLVLTPKNSTPEEKAEATEVMVIVCPKCRILFFDKFHYGVLQGVKRR